MNVQAAKPGTKKLLKGREHSPLYIQLIKDMNKRMSEGEFAVGGAIPSEAKLVDEYGVSRLTVVRALKEMENEGLLKRVHGIGTFVEKAVPKFSAKEMVGIATHTTGHIYGHLTGEIIRLLQAHKYYCVVLDCQSMEKNPGEREKLKSLLERNPAFLVVDGYSKFPYEILKFYSGNIIFVHMAEIGGEYDADYVLSDYYAGGRKVAGHFFSLGFEKIIFYMKEICKNPRSRDALVKGGMDFFAENNLPPVNISVVNTSEEVVSRLSPDDGPAAVFCGQDSAAGDIYKYARKNGLRIPDDLSIIGYYNTPWCEVYEPGLTSVCIREEDLANLVIARILSGNSSKEKILVEPEIVERKSCLNIT